MVQSNEFCTKLKSNDGENYPHNLPNGHILPAAGLYFQLICHIFVLQGTGTVSLSRAQTELVRFVEARNGRNKFNVFVKPRVIKLVWITEARKRLHQSELFR